MDVTCTIIGSFPDDYDLKVYAACEGHFTSSMKDVKQDQDDKNKYTVDITISPNAVYDSDFNGKLTVYCPYYGNTGIGQLNLTATGVGIEIKSVEKGGNDLNAIISLDGIVEKSGEKLQVKVVGGDFDPKDPWISMGGVSNPSNSKIEQTLNLTPYVIGSKEDLDKNQVRPLTSRTCTLAVVTPSGREAGYFQIDQTPIINLADQGSANCYIISAPGRYMLPARKGNGGPLWSTCPSNVSIVKTSTDDGKNTVNLEFSLLNYQKEDYIVFDVPNTIQNGNTVIALKEGNTILWSWHLWFCGDSRPDDVDLLDKYPTVQGEWNESKVMNRALGATSTIDFKSLGISETILSLFDIDNTEFLWNDGLYYQWGRKDPMKLTANYNIEEVSSNASYVNAVQNPSVFYSDWTKNMGGWGVTKSVNDPCPPGYKVPQNTVWRESNPDEVVDLSLTEIESSTSTAYAFNLTREKGEKLPSRFIFLSYPSTIVDGNLKNNPQKNITIAGEMPEDAKITTGMGLGSTIYKKVKFTIECETYEGGIWSTSPEESLKYMHAIKVDDAVVKVISGEQWTIERSMSWEGWKPVYTETESKVKDLTPGETLSGNTIVDQFVKYLNTYDPNYEYDSANGLQVRCVKESNQ